LKVAGLMPVGKDTNEFLFLALAKLRELTDTVIILADNSDVAFTSADEVIYIRHNAGWHDSSNRMTLFARAIAHGCDWCMRLDSDEVTEPSITKDIIDQQIREAEKRGIDSIRWKMREMWNDKEFRVDGVWGDKTKIILQRNPLSMDVTYWGDSHCNRLHVQPVTRGEIMDVPFKVLHYGMSTPELRKLRHQKYKELDPDNIYQERGYDYFLDEDGMKLKSI
jgi:hypothetical protein